MVDMKPVDSSNVAAVGYEPGEKGEGVLHVQFKNGGRYSYQGVSPAHHEDLIGAKSIGSHFYNHIQGKFPHAKAPETPADDEDDGA